MEDDSLKLTGLFQLTSIQQTECDPNQSEPPGYITV